MELDPTWTRGYYLTGVAFISLGRFGEAEDVLKTGLRFSHSSEPLLRALADARKGLARVADPPVYQPHFPQPRSHPLYDNGRSKGHVKRKSVVGLPMSSDPPNWPDDGTPYHVKGKKPLKPKAPASLQGRKGTNGARKQPSGGRSSRGSDGGDCNAITTEKSIVEVPAVSHLGELQSELEGSSPGRAMGPTPQQYKLAFMTTKTRNRQSGQCPPPTPKEDDVQVRGETGLLPRESDQQPTVVNLVQEMWASKHSIVDRYTGGQFYDDLKKVIKYATRTLMTLPVAKRDIVIFDIDDTILDSFPAMQSMNFSNIPKLVPDYINAADAPPLPSVHKLYRQLLERGYEAVFVTSRSEQYREATLANLQRANYGTFERLVMRQPEELLWTVFQYKSTARRRLVEEDGFNVVASIGDQWSDITGEYSALGVKVPNFLSYFA